MVTISRFIICCTVPVLFAPLTQAAETTESLHEEIHWLSSDDADGRDAIIRQIRAMKDVNIRDEVGCTPLHYAVRFHKEVAEELLKRGADVNARSEMGETPLHIAAERCSEVALELMASYGANPYIRDAWGRTPSDVAGEDGAGFSLHTLRTNAQVPLLHFAVQQDADGKLSEWFSYHEKQELETRDSFGRTPLHLAAVAGNVDVMQWLLEQGCDVNSKDKLGETPLHKAASHGHERAVNLLLRKGGDVAAVDAEGRTVVHFAAMKSAKLLNTLKYAGASLQNRDSRGMTALHFAAAAGCDDAVRYLVRNGIRKDTRTNNGDTPLHAAVVCAKYDTALLLKKLGADLTVKNNADCTAGELVPGTSDEMIEIREELGAVD